jgi:CubicO group peptidase (beta-lactamase class C family)
MIKYIFLGFQLLLLLNAFGQTTQDFNKFIDSAVTEVLKKSELESLSIGIVKDGKTQIRYYGDIGNGKKSGSNNYFEIASITKTFTGLLLAQAVTENKISIDDDVRKYLPGDYLNLEVKGIPVTFRNLATHRSGLPYMFPNKPEIFTNPDYDKLPFIIDSLEKNLTKEDFFSELKKVKLDTFPGARFNYSNVGANLMAYILENVYKMSYAALLEKYIFKNAKMSSTKLMLDQNEKKNLVQGYNTKHIKMPFFSSTIRAAGALKSTLPDMMKYIMFQLNEDNEAVKLSHEQIWKEDNGTFMAGYYWQMFSNNGNKQIFQNGGSFGTSSWLEFYPQDNIGFFLVTNVSGPDIHNQLSILIQQIYKRIKSEK